MSTTEKGEAFEGKVYNILMEMLASGGFLVSSQYYTLYRHKKYFSRSSDSDIVVDLSIELSREKETKPALYFMIECKDYGKPLPVNEVEEFFTKTRQIAGLNVKSILFSTTSLQKAAFNFATSNGIAVVRVLDDDSLAWLIERTNKHLVTSPQNSAVINVLNALTNEYFVSTRHSIYCFDGDKPFCDINSMFLEISQRDQQH